jgi:adenylate cyclase
MTHPARSSLPSIDELNTGIVATVIRGSYNKDNHEGNIRDETGQGYLFRVTTFALGERYNGNILLLAAQDDFVQNVRRLQFNGLVLAIIVGAAFLPIVWMFGSRMSRSLQSITAQARQLQTLAEPKLVPVTSYIKEIHALGSTMNVAQRAIWSFAHFVPAGSPAMNTTTCSGRSRSATNSRTADRVRFFSRSAHK